MRLTFKSLDELEEFWQFVVGRRMAEEAKEEVSKMAEGEELAGRMASMTIGEDEDEIARAQLTMHMLRFYKAQAREELKCLEAEERRNKFAQKEYEYD